MNIYGVPIKMGEHIGEDEAIFATLPGSHISLDVNNNVAKITGEFLRHYPDCPMLSDEGDCICRKRIVKIANLAQTIGTVKANQPSVTEPSKKADKSRQ